MPDADRELEQLYRKRRSQLVRRTAVWGSVAALIALAVWLAPSLVGRQAQQVVHTAPAVDAVTLQTSRGARLTIGSADDDAALHTLGATLADGGSRLAYDDRSATPVQMQVLSTPARRTFHVTLAAGTVVWLNAGSRLIYPNRFPDGGAALDRSRYHFVCHFITSWHQIEARFSNSVCVAVFEVIPIESALHKTLSAL